jgi:acyl carrier protein
MITRDEVKDVVFTSVATTFGFPKHELEEGMNASDVEGWDSVSTSHLLLDIEERIGCELDIMAILEAKNLREMIDVIHPLVQAR